MNHASLPQRRSAQWMAVAISIVTGLLISVITWQLYTHTVDVLTVNLKDRLLGIVRTGAAQFDPRDLDTLRQEDDWHKPEWRKVVTQLRRIREENDQVLFAYIIRRTASGFEFVADSHSINPYARIDLNRDGTIDDADQLQWPGQAYDNPPPETQAGLSLPITSQIYTDQWGQEITGYAPIRGSGDKPVAVLAIDMKADDFVAITHTTLYPFLAFITVLFFILIVLVFALMTLWRRQVHLLEQIDQHKDELISMFSHQLVSPLSAIRLMVEDFESRLSGQLQTDARAIWLATLNVLDLATVMLNLSRIRLGRLEVRPVEVDMQAFMEQLLAVPAMLAKEKGIELIADLPKRYPHTAFDSQLTHACLDNLLTNAIKYTPKGGKVSLQLRFSNTDIVCSVTDSGIGIPTADLPNLFQNGFRAGNVGGIPGSGFGLFIAKASVEKQGGTLQCTSHEGHGTTFTATLPTIVVSSPQRS